MKTAPLGMLADDLAGAMDAGMQLLPAGRPVHIFPDPGRGALRTLQDGWAVMNTDSRNLPARAARERVAGAARRLRDLGIPLRYKKIDSTLRGNLGAEMGALLDAGVPGIIVAPALPAGGRVTLHGVQHVHGRPLAGDELSKDPFSPVREGSIAGRIASGCEQRVRLVGLEVLRQGDIPALAGDILRTGERIIVCDAAQDEDLALVARLCRALSRFLPCGSAGLIAALSEAGSAVPGIHGQGKGPALILCGSPAKVSKAQLDHAEGQSRGFRLFRTDPARMSAEERQGILIEALASLQKGSHVALDVAADGKEALAAAAGETLNRDRAVVQNMLNALALRAAEAGQLHTWMAIGGDSAAGVLSSLGVSHIRLLGQAQPLMPFGRCMNGLAEGSLIITKAGGFGWPGSISNILEAIGS